MSKPGGPVASATVTRGPGLRTVKIEGHVVCNDKDGNLKWETDLVPQTFMVLATMTDAEILDRFKAGELRNFGE